jgi:hypothetical protein
MIIFGYNVAIINTHSDNMITNNINYDCVYIIKIIEEEFTYFYPIIKINNIDDY